jgi:hypothetical protein
MNKWSRVLIIILALVLAYAVIRIGLLVVNT